MLQFLACNEIFTKKNKICVYLVLCRNHLEFNEFCIDLNFQFITQYKIISLILKFFYSVTQTLFSRHQKLSSRLFLFETDATLLLKMKLKYS